MSDHIPDIDEIIKDLLPLSPNYEHANMSDHIIDLPDIPSLKNSPSPPCLPPPSLQGTTSVVSPLARSGDDIHIPDNALVNATAADEGASYNNEPNAGIIPDNRIYILLVDNPLILVSPSQQNGNPESVASKPNEPQPDPSCMLVNPSQLERNPEYVASEPNEPQPGPNRMLGKKQTGRKPQGNPNKRPMYEENEDEYPNKEDKKRIRASKTSHKARLRINEEHRKMKEYIKRGLPKP